MKKILILLIAFCYSCFVYAQEQTWRTIPYFLKGYEAQYEKSPKEAALAWFKDARFGLFVLGACFAIWKRRMGDVQ